MIRDIGRTIEGNSGLEAAFAKLLPLAWRVREQQRQRGPKAYPLHAPEVECIGKGKSTGLRVRRQSLRCHDDQPREGGQFVTHV